MALAKNKFLPEMSKEVRDIYDRLPSEDDVITQQRERQQYYSLNEVKKALEKNRGREEAVYRTMADSLTRDKDAMRELLREDPRVWKYIHPELRTEVDMKRACLSSYNNHMKSININGDIALMYPSQLPTDVINDPRVILPAYHQAYQAQIQGQLPDGRPLSALDQQGQRLEDRLMTMEMVLRAKSGPAMQQELSQVESEVIRNNKDDVAKVATRDPRIMEAVEARAPEAKKEIEMKRQEFEMAYLRGQAMDTAHAYGRSQDAVHTEYNVGVTASSQSAAVEGIAQADNFTQDGVEDVQQGHDDWDPTGKSNEEKYIEFKEARGDYNDPDGDGIRNDQDLDDYTPYNPFASPGLLEEWDQTRGSSIYGDGN